MRFLLTLASLTMLACNVRADEYEFLDPSTGKTWSPSIGHIIGGSGNYPYMSQYAADFVSTNYNDWRIPTLAEMQEAIANGTIQRINQTNIFGMYISYANGSGALVWTSTRRGNKNWAVDIRFDMNGSVISSRAFLTEYKLSDIHSYMVRP